MEHQDPHETPLPALWVDRHRQLNLGIWCKCLQSCKTPEQYCYEQMMRNDFCQLVVSKLHRLGNVESSITTL